MKKIVLPAFAAAAAAVLAGVALPLDVGARAQERTFISIGTGGADR